MANRLLNASTDPQRMIRAMRLPNDLQRSLMTSLEPIWAAQDIVTLTHAHGRAIGLATGLGLVDAITHTQFLSLGKAYMRAFESRLAVLTDSQKFDTDALS
jgi:hypothetical protein